MDQELIARRHEIMKRRFVRSAKRHHHGEEYILKISLRQTRHRMRIIKLQPAVKVHFLVYQFLFFFCFLLDQNVSLILRIKNNATILNR